MKSFWLMGMVFCLSLLFTFGNPVSAEASNPPKIYLDGDKVVSDVDPIIETSRVLVPVRFVAEALEATVFWDHATKTVTIHRDQNRIVIRIGNPIAYCNGTPIELDVPAQVVTGRTMVPLRFVAESLDVKVDWMDRFKAVEIASKSRLAIYYPKVTNTDAYLVREIHEVPYTISIARTAVEELINGQVLTPGAYRVLPADTKVLGLTIKDGLATVDFSPEVLNANVGSALEAIGIQSIVNTLTEFPTVDKVKFLVEGKVDERTMDWWGHVGLHDQPFSRNVAGVYEPFIWLTSPYPGALVESPLTVRGSARVYEGTVQVRLLDANGRELAKGFATAVGPSERGDFTLNLNFSRPATQKLTLEAFWIDAADGSERGKVVIPLNYGY